MAKAQLWDCSDILKIEIFRVVTNWKHPPLLSKLNKQMMSMHNSNQQTELRAVF